MDAVFLSRLQFALTIGFHFLFPPLTIGLAWLVVYFTFFKEEVARFWIKILTITFAVGVATGITMEFQFGTNWAAYAKYVGDVFGAPLAIEAIFTFFLESTFIAVLYFGLDRFPKNIVRLSAVLVAVGTTLSAFWILVANSWMQTPAGFHIVNGRAEMTSFLDVVFNPSMLPRFFHTMTACLATGAFFVVGTSAFLFYKNRMMDIARASIRPALVLAIAAALLQGGLGHWHAVQVANTQPEKLATFEGLATTQSNAPLLIFGVPDEESRSVDYAVKIPSLLSLLVSGDKNKVITGMDDFEKSDLPPFAITFYSFHLMVVLGFYFIGISLLAGVMEFFGKLEKSRLVQLALILTIPLPFITNEVGWMAAEVGRQPWAVYHVLKTADAVSMNVPAAHILATIIGFSLTYAAIFCVWVYLIWRQFKPSGSGL